MGTRGHTKEQYHSFGSSYCIDFDSQDEMHCNFGRALLYLMTSMHGGLRWVVVYGRVTWDWDWNWNADGHTKTSYYCYWRNTEVLAVPIALTSKVKMNCIAILALLCCT
jgi:hypothetical protein